MQRKARELRYFFFSQAFADGLRTTFAILLPALVAFYFNIVDLGMTISLGALAVSLTDSPGPVMHKRNGMLITLGFIFLVSLLTPLARMNVYLLGLEIFLVSFFFSMFTVYGTRATAVGNAVILVMILTMDHPVLQNEVLVHAGLITGGGAWYIFMSLFFYRLQPYRIAQRSLGESIRELANYVMIKADFYDPSTSLDENYKKLVAQQIVVNEKQDLVREVLFKTRQIVNESTPMGRKLVWTFVETVDLFENVTATYYDYDSLRKRFGHTKVILQISGFIRRIGYELDKTGISIQNNIPESINLDFDERLLHLKNSIDELSKTGEENILVLKKILVNLRKLVQGFRELNKYFERNEEARPRRNQIDHSHFVGHQPLDPVILFNNITLESSVFKHALRVAVACLAGYLVTKTISYGNYSYWILMTIAFIIKPAFSLTRQRNIERIIGTLAGGLIGVLILLFITQKNIQFSLMVLFMLLTYSFMRINYLAMVIFVTPFVLILFNMLGVSFSEVATERVLDTIIGCAIALSVSYFLFPTWESEQLRKHMDKMRKANADYLRKIAEALRGMEVSLLDYKLVRKEVYVSSANLSAAFQRMLSEPKTKQTNNKLVHQYVVLNHLLFSNIATVATTLLSRPPKPHPAILQQLVKKSLHQLEKEEKTITGKKSPADAEPLMLNSEELLLKDQLEFIHKLTTDIDKTERSMNAPGTIATQVHTP